MSRFDRLDDASIKRMAERVELGGHEQRLRMFETAIDYIDGRMYADTESELRRRAPASMKGESGQGVFPFCIPLAKRYAAEAANAYNREVDRYFVDEAGEENDATREQTSKFKEMLDEARHDEEMHRNEKLMLTVKTGVVWPQAKRGNLSTQVVGAHRVHPIRPDDQPWMDPADPDDYEAFVVEIYGGESKEGAERQFAMLNNASFAFYEGKDASKVSRVLSEWPNPFLWDQATDDPDPVSGLTNTTRQELPLRMLTFWHDEVSDCLIPGTDAPIVQANREINIALSSILDVIRFQGHAVPVYKSNNPDNPKAIMRHGARFPKVIEVNEAFDLVSSATSYADQISVLKDLVRMLAICERMSPNDFAIDGAPLTSGFAKLVDSLPKIEARDERIRWLTLLEEQEMAPRLISIGILLGKLDQSARKMRLRVRFPGVDFPKTEDEKTAKLDRELKHDLTTPAQVLAEQDGITEEEAQKRIEANAEANRNNPDRQPEQPPQQQQGFGVGGLLGMAQFGKQIRKTDNEDNREDR